jgi:hypothetical protein
MAFDREASGGRCRCDGGPIEAHRAWCVGSRRVPWSRILRRWRECLEVASAYTLIFFVMTIPLLAAMQMFADKGQEK